mmetsp:Transcript_4921/g.9271  ORF Transcript_4921/g.9271 Transcript_4921/m.9271 type:complete len:482 (+) Transcript_4921:739-2184(+)
MSHPLSLGLVKCCKPPDGKKFQIPSWAAKPTAGAALHVTKAGNTLSTLKIDCHKYYMFGRAPDTCKEGKGYEIRNPTLSRQHAVLVHGKDGTLYLIDLASSYGSLVNGERIEAYSPRLLENGNILKFGQSTRGYVVRLFPKEAKLRRIGSKLSLDYKTIAALRVSTGNDNDIIIKNSEDQSISIKDVKEESTDEDEDDEDDDYDEEEDDDDQDDTEDATMSPATRTENAQQRLNRNQAKLFTGLNACVSYPSPKSLLNSRGLNTESLRLPSSLSADKMAEAVAATDSPAPSPKMQPNAPLSRENVENQIRGQPLSLPSPAVGRASPEMRFRSTSVFVPRHNHGLDFSDGHSTKNNKTDSQLFPSLSLRVRSNSTCSALRKRPAQDELVGSGTIRRKSVVPGRRVSFCNSLEFIDAQAAENAYGPLCDEPIFFSKHNIQPQPSHTHTESGPPESCLKRTCGVVCPAQKDKPVDMRPCSTDIL